MKEDKFIPLAWLIDSVLLAVDPSATATSRRAEFFHSSRILAVNFSA